MKVVWSFFYCSKVMFEVVTKIIKRTINQFPEYFTGCCGTIILIVGLIAQDTLHSIIGKLLIMLCLFILHIKSEVEYYKLLYEELIEDILEIYECKRDLEATIEVKDMEGCKIMSNKLCDKINEVVNEWVD